MDQGMFSSPTVVFLIIGLAAGISVALIIWLITQAIAAVPEEDREYKDRPPLALRLLWWPIQWLSHYLEPYLSVKYQRRLASRLRLAGLEFSVSPSQYVATRIVGVALMALVGYLLPSMFDKSEPSFSWLVYVQGGAMAAVLGWIYPAIWLRDRIIKRRKEVLKSLPFFLDIITLCVEAGLNFQGAIAQAVAKAPKGILRNEFERVLRDIRAGKQRAESIRAMAVRLKSPTIRSFVSSVIQAEAMGMSLGPVLRAQSDQRRAERFLRAEKLAMEAPVKMLFPLIAFIFPCTFIVLFFPIVIKFMHSGL